MTTLEESVDAAVYRAMLGTQPELVEAVRILVCDAGILPEIIELHTAKKYGEQTARNVRHIADHLSRTKRMNKRYTIELRLVEVHEDGDTAPNEEQGITLSYATGDYDGLYRLMDSAYDLLEDLMHENLDDTSPRRPEGEDDE